MDEAGKSDAASAELPLRLRIHFALESDATFGRGDGIAGLVDEEADHDADGLPVLRGRALKGMLNEECANILYSLEEAQAQDLSKWRASAQRLFGGPGSGLESQAKLRFGNAQLPDAVREAVRYELKRNSSGKDRRLDRSAVLDTLTAIRRQTAMDVTGTPRQGSLRAMRVVLRQTPFEAALIYHAKPGQSDEDRDRDLALLAACVMAWRRAGTGRNRGRGRLRASLHDSERSEVTPTYFKSFEQQVCPQETQP